MSVPLDDRGLLLGDGLFETILAVDGGLMMFDAHAARMRSGAAALGIEPPAPEALRETAELAVAASGLKTGRAAVRVTLTAGSGGRGLDRPTAGTSRLFATAAPSPRPDGPLHAVISEVRRNDRSPASRLKTLAYLDNVLARREARTAGADEALMLNTGGHLACAAAANLFWIAEDGLLTPALDCGALDGTMRRVLMDRAPGCGLEVREVRAGPEALDAAEAVFITNSLIGLRPITRLGFRDLPPSPWLRALAAALEELC